MDEYAEGVPNLSPGFERSENPGVCTDDELKPCKGLAVGEPLQGLILIFYFYPRVVAALQPWLKLANAFGVFKLNHYSQVNFP